MRDGVVRKVVMMLAVSGLSLLVVSFLWQTGQARSTPHRQKAFLNPASNAHVGASSNDTDRPHRIAVVGGGASGTSAAFFLSEIARTAGKPTQIHLFERRDYLGGRSTVVYPFDEEGGEYAYEPIEAGASIFVDANLNLQKAVKVFGLKTMAYGGERDGGRLGVWDGEEMVWEETPNGSGWWDKARMFWRYGRALYQLRSLTAAAVDNFLKLYQADFNRKGPYATISEMAAGIGDEFRRLPTMTGTEYLVDEQNVNPLAVNELVEVATRTNYGTDISEIHALASLVSLAANNAVSVKGGNRQMFENFASYSRAKVSLSVQVTTIGEVEAKDGRKEYTLEYHDARPEISGSSTETFDTVILAAPYSQAGLNLITSDPTSAHVPPQTYVHLHVTFIATNASSPSAKAFGRKEKDWPVPKTVLSTMMRNVEGGGKHRPRFNSLSFLRNVGQRKGIEGDVHMVKMFSESRLPEDYLATVFGGAQNIIWTKYLEWDAYPLLHPVPPEKDYAPIRLAEGVYYANGWERLVSTMETSTVSAWNVAGLVARDRWGYKVDKSWAEWDLD